MPNIIPTPDQCECCGEDDFFPCFLPEGQCYCEECAAEYWNEEFSEEDEADEY